MSASWKDRLVSAIATGALVLGMVPYGGLVWALDQGSASVLDSTATTADPQGPGYKLTVTGLEAGDAISYYRIIEQDVDDTSTDPATVGTQKWKLSDIIDADGDGIVDGTENAEFGHQKLENGTTTSEKGLWVDEMVITNYTTKDNAGQVVSSDTRQLTPAMVNAIATAVTNNVKNGKIATGTGVVETGSDKYEVADATSGLYMFVAVPDNSVSNNREPDYIYKPVFVAADYYNTISVPEDGTHAMALEDSASPKNYAEYYDSTKPEGNSGVFKKSPLSIDKQAGKKDGDGNYTDLQSDVAVGDTIDFSITVPVPTYTKNYVAPQFYVTDTLTTGLKLVENSIEVKVKNGTTEVETHKDVDYKIFTKTTTGYTDFAGMTIDTEGFVVQFLNDNPTTTTVKQDGFLYTVVGAPTATITYQATVTTEDGATFAQQINQMDNTAKLIYSRDPNFIPYGYYKTVKKTDEHGDPIIDPNTGQPATEDVPDNDFDSDDPSNKKPEDPNNPGHPSDTPEPTGLLQDKTRHYTFDIDADVLGRDQSGDKEPGQGGEPGTNPLPESEHDNTSEIRKVWIDANGTEIDQDKLTSDITKSGGENGAPGSEYNGKDGVYGWLEGAEFSLTQVQSHAVTGAGTGTFTNITPVEVKFDTTSHIRVTTGGTNPTSDARGYIAMKGLDAGTYELKEVRAPLGYAFNPNITYTIKITPTYVMEPKTPSEGTTPEDGKGGADDLILESYTVTITTSALDKNLNEDTSKQDVVTTCTYVLKKDADDSPVSLLTEDGTSNTEPTTSGGTTTPAAAGIDTTITSYGQNQAAIVYNQKLGILPATGGSGILFYLFVGGAVAGISWVLMGKLKRACLAA